MIKILVDSSADYSLEEINSGEIDMISMCIAFGEEQYIEGQNITRCDFFERLSTDSEFPQTNPPQTQDFVDYFEKIKENQDELIYICLSSALSNTFQCAMEAKGIVGYKEIYIIDSLTATYAIKILADYALQLVKEGISVGEVVDRVETLASNVKIYAVLDTLEYLGKGGRLKRSVATIGDLINIKPLITVNKNGEIDVLDKTMGRNKALDLIMQHLESVEINKDFPIYSIYSLGTENSDRFEKQLLKKHISPKTRNQIGPTIGTHVGPGAYGIVFVCK